MPDDGTRMFKFSVEHCQSHERTEFYGTGATMIDALKDGVKTAGEPFRPKTDGRIRPPGMLHVTLPDRRLVQRTVEAFESGVPYPGDDDLRDRSHPSFKTQPEQSLQ